jgi:transposase-like protein
MSTKNKKASPTGIRYTDAQKKEVVAFVAQYNSANGRGGQSAAAAKFKVTPLTISAWIKALGAPAAKGAKVVKAAKVAKPAKAVKAGKTKKGVRYSAEQKQEVVDFVSSYNAANGRGGQSQAAKKFNLSVLTVSAWLKAAGTKKAPKAAKAAKPAKAAKAAKPAKAAKASKGMSELEALKAAIRALVK